MSAVVVDRNRRRESLLGAGIVVGSLIILVIAVAAGVTVTAASAFVVLAVVLALAHDRLLTAPALISLTILTILFVPIKRYTLPAALPFNLEAYRLVVALVIVAWVASLLIDTRVSVRKSGFEAPIVFILVGIVLSLFANTARVNAVGPDVVKSVTFFGSFIVIFYVIVSVARAPRDLDLLVRVLAGGGAVLGFFGIVESATGFNVFNHLHKVFPILEYYPSLAPQLERNGSLRAYASAQHPIAFGAALAVLLPLAVYRARSFGGRRWWFAALLILMGLLASRSRTAILMLIAITLVYAILRSREMKRLWPAIFPVLLIVHFALPGTLGSIKASFFPTGGIVAQQAHASVGSGRLATLGPALRTEFEPDPLLGEGFGTRVTTPDPVLAKPNAPILDDEWLGILLETGVAGVGGFLWLFVRSTRRMGGSAKHDPSPRGWLLVATTAGVAGYAVGMFTYDAFSFIQVTFLLFIVLGIGAAVLQSSPADWEDFQRAEDGRARLSVV